MGNEEIRKGREGREREERERKERKGKRSKGKGDWMGKVVTNGWR